MANKCCMCDRHIEREDAPVLAMGAAGIPRLLCDDCAELLDTATLGQNYDEIKDAMSTISDIMSSNDPDGVTYTIVSELMVQASERAKAIDEGVYDFSLDEAEDEDQLEDIPEDMQESEEDKKKDEEDEIKLKRFDKVYNAIFIAVAAAAALFIIYRVLDTFLF